MAEARGLLRQTLAILAAKSRVPLLGRIGSPTLVIHGQDDPLVPVKAAHELARLIPGARLELIPGMGHNLPAALLPRLSALASARHFHEFRRSFGTLLLAAIPVLAVGVPAFLLGASLVGTGGAMVLSAVAAAAALAAECAAGIWWIGRRFDALDAAEER